jgi:glutaredoxin
MEIPKPKNGIITVYSKSGCPGCNNVKKLLIEKHINHTIIDCDEFLLENREALLYFMETIAGMKCNIFPMVFDGNTFIGGYKQTLKYFDDLINFDSFF